MSAERRRLTLALLLSLLIHALLSSLTFGGQGLGLPGFGFPWQLRRVEVPDLHIVLAPAPIMAAELAEVSVNEPLQQASTTQPAFGSQALTPSVPPAPALDPTAAAAVTEATLTAPARPTAQAEPDPETAGVAVPAQTPLRTIDAGGVAQTPAPEPVVIAAGPSAAARVLVPAMPSMPTPVLAAAPSASSPQTVVTAPREAFDAAQKRIDAQAQAQAQAQAKAQARAAELAKLESAALEAQRQAAQLEAARIEAAWQEAERQQAARQEAARLETARQETARQEAAREEAARQEVARQEAAREEEARIERRRAMGRQLDEEAARREAAAAAAGLPSRLAPAPSGARRGRLFGRTDSNAELILYAEAWARKIQLNMTIDMVREAAKRPHTDPLVTVAIRSDGSVESVTFVRSSGVAEIDEAIRRIVQSQLPYAAFPPGLASEFDVIEIRRTWHFDMAVRLY